MLHVLMTMNVPTTVEEGLNCPDKTVEAGKPAKGGREIVFKGLFYSLLIYKQYAFFGRTVNVCRCCRLSDIFSVLHGIGDMRITFIVPYNY